MSRDTSSVTMSVIIYHLASNPSLQRKLQAELDSAAAKRQKDPAPPTESPEDTYYRSISSLPYLNGCVSEALRIQPPVHGGIQRKTPPEGIHIPNEKGTSTFIPGHTLVSVPILPVQNDPRYYRNPEEYVPERWTDEKPDWIMNRAAYFPFVGGAYSCVGKGLAYIELRVVVAMLFGRFNVRLAEGEDGRRFREETRDTFVASLGEFRVVFSERAE